METRSQKKESSHLFNPTEADPRSSAPPSMLTPNADGENVIMKAITGTKEEFLTNFTGILNAIQDLKSNFNEFTNRLTEAKQRIGGTEGRDAVTFLERWLPETFGSECFSHPLFIERAHRLHQSRQDRNIPRVLIMRFLNFKDKERAICTARAKENVIYKDQEVKFFQVVARETHTKRTLMK